MAYRLELTRYAVAIQDWQYFGAYRMRVEVTAVEGDGLDPYIFVYQQGDRSPYSGETQDQMVAVAGPAQIAAIPVQAANPKVYWPFYRLNYLEQDYDNEAQAMTAWAVIQAQACTLCTAMATFKNLQRAETVWIPDIPPNPQVSESDSERAHV